MGRFLDIARRHPALLALLPAPPPPTPAPCAVPALPPVLPAPQTSPTPLDQPAADVLAALVHADQPLTHTALLRALAARGHDPTIARQAIARCQRRRWIEHNLITGYELVELTSLNINA